MTESKEAYIGVDVGGTSIEAACITADGNAKGPIKEMPSPSNEPKEEVINVLLEVINSVNNIDNYRVIGCGIGMPGPFDYEKGISSMRHKFSSIYGIDILTPLQQTTELPVYFINDAAAFGFGCSWKVAPEASRIIALTIGTGLGSSFIENGESLDNDPRVPKDGEIWNLAFGGGLLEDAVSGQAVTRTYQSRTGKNLSAKAIADLARGQDKDAVYAYALLGRSLGQGLLPVSKAFKPEKIIIGGRVAAAFELFEGPLKEALGGSDGMVLRAPLENLAVYGAARYVMSHRIKT